MKIIYKFKRVLTFFVLCCILCTVFFSNHSYLVFASSSNDAFHNAIDPTLWGEGLSWDECSAEQKEYRAKQLAGMYVNDIARAACSVLGGVAGQNLYDLVFNSTVKGRAIAQGYTTETEYLMRNAGLGYLFDTEDPTNLPTHLDNVTFSADLLNTLQQAIKDANEANSDIVNCLVYDVNDPTSILYVYYRDPVDWDDSWKGYVLAKQNFIKSKLKYNWPTWCASAYVEDGNNSANRLCIHWVEAPMSDFVYYLTSVKKSDFGYHGPGIMRRKDNNSFTVNYAYLEDPSGAVIYSSSKEVTSVNLPDILKTPAQYGTRSYIYYGTNGNLVGLYYNQSTFGFYRSAGHMSSAMTYGPSLPPFIQSSGAANTVYDSSVTITGDQIKNYDYSTVINNIGDTTGMNAEELQQRIDEVMGELGAIGGTAEDISHNTELQVSVLHKILDKLDDIYDKIGSGGGGVISDIADFVHWSELQLKLDAIIANLTSIRNDVDDISDNQSDMDALLNKLDQESQGLANKAKSKFPFCIPWDMLILYKSLEAMPQVPTFNWTLTIPSWGIEEEFTIDLSKFEIVAKISRYFFDIIFFMALCKLGLSMSGYSFSIEKT